MSALDDLTAEVGKIETSIAAAIAKIDGGSSDATQLAALTARLSTAQASLNTAVTATSS